MDHRNRSNPASAARDATPPEQGAGDPMFAPVRTRRAFESVCDQIREQVAAGELAPGDRLPGERELAEQFAVSRNAVREALRSLEMAGVVECTTGVHGGYFIRRGSPDGITQAVRDMLVLGRISVDKLTEARVMITALAIRLACERATPEDFDAIEADIERTAAMTRQGDLSRRALAVTEFHRLLARATHNEVFVMLIDALSEIVRSLLLQVDPTPHADVLKVRRAVLRHMRAGNAERAIAIMSRHLKALTGYLQASTRHITS